MAEQYGIILFLRRLEDGIIQNSCNKKEITNRSSESSKTAEVSKNKKFFSYIKDISFVSVSAQIMIFPIIAYIYKTMSFTFIITNILTSYLIGIIIIFGFILVLISFPFFSLAKLLGKAYKLLIDLLLFITENTAKIPFSRIYIKAPYMWEIVIYYVLIFSFLYLHKRFRI